MNQSMLSNLAQLIAPMALETFIGEYWLKQPVAVHGSLQRLPQWLTRSPLDDFYSLAARYRGRLSIQSGRYSTKQVPLQNAHPADLHEMGLSIYFHDILDYVDGAADYVHRLAKQLGLRNTQIKAAAFASPPGEGLGFHYDTYEIFSIQLCGSKTFKLATLDEIRFPCGQPCAVDAKPSDELYPQMANGFPRETPQHYETVRLEPGSVLFMPRGTWHSTEAGESSLSVSIALLAPPALDTVLDHMRTLLLQDPRWRKPLYGLSMDSPLQSEASKQINELTRELVEQLETFDTTEVRHYADPDTHQSKSIRRHTRLQRNPVCTLSLGQNSDQNVHVVLRCFERGFAQPYGTDTEFEIPAALRPVVEWIDATRQPFTPDELARAFADVPFDELRALLEALREGELLRRLWFKAREPGNNDKRNMVFSAHYTLNNISG